MSQEGRSVCVSILSVFAFTRSQFSNSAIIKTDEGITIAIDVKSVLIAVKS